MSLLSKHKHPAYHLRPNKAVDRFILVELIRSLELYGPLTKHVYIGFGGPFLEDFRLLAQIFPSLDLISIEVDNETYKRQIFHSCSSKMTVINNTFSNYLATNFPSDRPVIVWADYTDMDRSCLLQAADIARRVTPSSIFRVTVRAESPIRAKLKMKFIPKHIPVSKEEAFRQLCKYYRDEMAVDGISFDSSWFTWDSFMEENYPFLLMQMIRAVIAGSCSSPKTFLPLHAVKYSDGTIMLSLTGIFCLEDEKEKVSNHFKTNCDFCEDGDFKVDEIDVPVLTTKERLNLEKVLPTPDSCGATCSTELGYLIEGDDSDTVSVRKMQHYEKYYRLYPYFGKLIP